MCLYEKTSGVCRTRDVLLDKEAEEGGALQSVLQREARVDARGALATERLVQRLRERSRRALYGLFSRVVYLAVYAYRNQVFGVWRELKRLKRCGLASFFKNAFDRPKSRDSSQPYAHKALVEFQITARSVASLKVAMNRHLRTTVYRFAFFLYLRCDSQCVRFS